MKYRKIYEVTPKEMLCGIGACHSIYEAQKEDETVYLIIGKVVEPSLAGLEKKVGQREVLIEVPKVLIDGRNKHV
ncbi:MAG: hypothetical protein AABW65_01240 [Nanoarchaeota archaeon]